MFFMHIICSLCHVELSRLKVFSLLGKKKMNIYSNYFQLCYKRFLSHDVLDNGYNFDNMKLSCINNWYVMICNKFNTKMLDKELYFLIYLSMIDEHTTNLYRV
jgi:hypothetical protein